VTGSAIVPLSLTQLIGYSTLNVGASSTAGFAPTTYPLCVLVTASTQVHTLLTGSTAADNFNTCMVQVNTTDWDAVEGRDSSSMTTTNGENCFVGSIHYGNIVPPKDPSCTFFPDPFANYAMPASAATCTAATNTTVTASGAVVNPGTYCGGLTINAGAVTMSPGLYIIKDGNFWVTGSSNVSASGVTIILTQTPKTGTPPNLVMDTSAKLNISPMTTGAFAGFAVYLDSNVLGSSGTGLCSGVADGAQIAEYKETAPGSGPGGPGPGPGPGPGSSNNCINELVGNAQMTVANGIVYTAGEALLINDAAQVNVTGTLIANFLVAEGSALVQITGTQNAANSASIAQLHKTSQSGVGTLSLLQ
jgi:hypothetical protein